MALERGGYADKLGNRYEGRWVARQLLMLLNEQYRSVMLEAVGDDEAGVDLWIERHDGSREAQQCKTENGTKSHWTLKDLKARGVLDHLKTQLQRSSRHRFSLISGSPAPQLRDLARSAKDSAGTVESFYEHQIQSGSYERQAAFTDWCSLLQLSESNAGGRAIAYDLLSRSDFHQFADDREVREDLRWMASQAAVGDADCVLALLADFAADNLRKAIVADDIWRHLQKSGYEPRKLFADERLGPRLEELRADFDDSIRPHLAGGREIPRPEVEDALALLNDELCTDAIILHGLAGQGKSGVLYQLTQRLRDQGTPFLALRLDRKHPSGSPRHFGKELGLPESPVNCLEAVAGDRHSVLILDQLDALRWTSAHATEGLEVCKALLREVRTMRSMGRRISIVLCCRTFDLEHDPQIRAWLQPSQHPVMKKIAVGELPAAKVNEFVTSFNVSFDRMTPRRQSLLRSVQNLAIWAEVVQSDSVSPEFDSGTDLMRAFWSNRRREIEKAGFSATERDRLLESLIDHMESSATLTAPRRLIESHERLATELQSLSVIHADKNFVSFCHQSYLDFLIANRVLGKLTTAPDAIVVWLGNRHEQSLFRREQLRQLLFLLADENPRELSAKVDQLLTSDAVRFHMKQLVVEAIGQLRPSEVLRNRVTELAESKRWGNHVIRDVLYGNVNWLQAFHESGRLVEWLLSSDESRRNTAVWLSNSVVSTMPTLIEEVLVAAHAAGLKDAVLCILSLSEPRAETEKVFDLRLIYRKHDSDSSYVSWKALADDKPIRAIRLLTANLQKSAECKELTRSNRRLRSQRDTDVSAILDAVKLFPKLTIRLLVPILVMIAKRKLREHRAWKHREDSDTKVERPRTGYPDILLAAVKAATVAVAAEAPDRFLRVSRRLGNIKSRAIQSLLVCAWTRMPDEYSDDAMLWLMADKRRLRCGSRRTKPRWHRAAKLITRHSPHCSESVFAMLERTLRTYRDPDEQRLAEFWLQHTRHGHFWNGFFAAQWYLLSALDSKRRSDSTTGRVGVLQRKFADYPVKWFVTTGVRGGFVRSPIRRSSLLKFSNKSWLRLITNARVPRRGNDLPSKKYLENSVIESSVETFARDFSVAAKCEPERFGRLVLEFPPNAPSDYVSEVFSALENKKPPTEVPEDTRAAWQPASRDCVEVVLESVVFHEDSDSMRRFCWLVVHRDDIRPSERVFNRLIELTKHSNPEPEKLVIGCDKSASEVDVHELENNSINCVRSLATIAIGSFLYENRELLEQFRPTLERLLHDPHPVVRTAMMEVCLAIWNIDRALAVEWLLVLAKGDLRLACGRSAQRLCNCAFPDFTEQLLPLIKDMIESPVAVIAEEGAQEATARWLFFNQLEDLMTHCLSGSEAQRKGVATIVGQHVRDDKYSEKCWPVLLSLSNDSSREVREKAAWAIHDERILATPASADFLKHFVTTAGFNDNPDSLIDALQDHPGTLVPFTDVVFAAVDSLVECVHNPDVQSKRRMSLIDRHVTTVVLRLYEQSRRESNQTISDRCLDMFDELLENRITPARLLFADMQR